MTSSGHSLSHCPHVGLVPHLDLYHEVVLHVLVGHDSAAVGGGLLVKNESSLWMTILQMMVLGLSCFAFPLVRFVL